MSNRIDSRIAALAAAIQRRKMEQAFPTDELSRSLIDFYREIRSMNALDLMELQDENGASILTQDQAQRMITDYQAVGGL